MAELVILRDHRPPRVLRLGARPLRLGRAPDNDVVIDDEAVSGHHALIWLREGEPWVEDLRSKNGTFIDGERLTGARVAKVGAQVMLGLSTRLVVQRGPEALVPAETPWVLEDLGSGLFHGLDQPRLRVGTSAACDLRLEGDGDEEVALYLDAGGEAWLDDGATARALAEGEEILIAGGRFRLHRPNRELPPTAQVEDENVRCALRVKMRGADGPSASLFDPDRNARYDVYGETRVALLHSLGRQILTDRGGRLPAPLVGWVGDEEIIAAIWGRMPIQDPQNSLAVLVLRARKDVKSAGFDPWLIERRRGRTRLRVGEVILDG